jgi:hypothetical protein
MIIRVGELKEIASEVRAAGKEAVQERMVGAQFALEGLRVQGEFYPLWELNLPANQIWAGLRKFEKIRKTRKASWSPQPPTATLQEDPDITGIAPLTAAEELFVLAKGLSAVCGGMKVLPLPWSVVRRQDPTLTEPQFRSIIEQFNRLDINAVMMGHQKPKGPMMLVLFDNGPAFKDAEVTLFEIPRNLPRQGPGAALFRGLSLS